MGRMTKPERIVFLLQFVKEAEGHPLRQTALDEIGKLLGLPTQKNLKKALILDEKSPIDIFVDKELALICQVPEGMKHAEVYEPDYERVTIRLRGGFRTCISKQYVDDLYALVHPELFYGQCNLCQREVDIRKEHLYPHGSGQACEKCKRTNNYAPKIECKTCGKPLDQCQCEDEQKKLSAMDEARKIVKQTAQEFVDKHNGPEPETREFCKVCGNPLVSCTCKSCPSPTASP